MGIRKNMISNLLLTSSAIIFPFITFPYVTRTLSSNSVGKYFFVDALTQYFIVFSAVGIPYYGIREIVKIRDDAPNRSKLVVELLAIQITLAIAFSIILIGIHYFIPTVQNEFGLIKVACLNIICTSFLMEWFYQGMESFAYITSRSLIIKTLSVAAILLLVKKSDDYLIYYLIATLVIVFNAALNFINYLKNYHARYTGTLNIKQHFKPLLVLFSINVSISIYTVLDTIILGLLTNPETVSYYSVPLKLARMYWLVVNGAGVVLIPRIASFFINKDMYGIREVMRKSLSIVFLLTIPFCVFCLMFPTEILTIISGAKYDLSANTLRILSVVPLIVAVFNVCGTQFLMPIGEEKGILIATIIGLVVSLSANFLLIPYFKYIGAAIACVMAEGTVCVYIVIAALRRLKLAVDHQLLFQILISLGITVAARAAIANHLGGLPIIIASACIYVAVFILLQLLWFRNKFIYSLMKSRSSKIKVNEV